MKTNYPLIMRGSIGDAVKRAQQLLIDHEAMEPKNSVGASNVDGIFGRITADATLRFQDAKGLLKDGKIGPHTWAALLGLSDESIIPEWPAVPPFSAISHADRIRLFGEFRYRPKSPGIPGSEIVILDNWEWENIETFFIPQLVGLPLYDPSNNQRSSGNVRLHRLAGPVFIEFLDRVEMAGYLPFLKTYDGAYYPRFVRGSRTSLSNHSWGTAMDFNAYANGMGLSPAGYGEDGCLLPLVSIANECGIYWGGHFERRDGMHFEVAIL